MFSYCLLIVLYNHNTFLIINNLKCELFIFIFYNEKMKKYNKKKHFIYKPFILIEHMNVYTHCFDRIKRNFHSKNKDQHINIVFF